MSSPTATSALIGSAEFDFFNDRNGRGEPDPGKMRPDKLRPRLLNEAMGVRLPDAEGMSLISSLRWRAWMTLGSWCQPPPSHTELSLRRIKW